MQIGFAQMRLSTAAICGFFVLILIGRDVLPGLLYIGPGLFFNGLSRMYSRIAFNSSSFRIIRS